MMLCIYANNSRIHIHTSLILTLAYKHILLYTGYEPPSAGHSRGAGRHREDRAVQG